MAVKITTTPEHPINRHLKNKKTYDQYGLRPSPTTSFFVRAKETCSMLEVDLKEFDQMVQPEYTPWITHMEVNFDTKILALGWFSAIYWVVSQPWMGHTGIQKADQHAKAALRGEINKNYKTGAEDWKNWIREKQEGIRQAEWTSSENPMVTVKPRIMKNNGAQALTRRD
jgi:hypothetical protein